MRELLAQALESSFDTAHLRQRFGQHLTQRSFDSHQLNAAYLAAVSHFLGLSFKAPNPMQLPNGLPLEEWGGHLHGKQVPHLFQAIELGILWALLGVLHKRDEYTVASLKIAHWFLNLLDPQGALMVGVWLPPADFSVQSDLHLLFKIASQISGDVRFERVSKISSSSLSPLMQKVEAFLLPKIEKQPRFPLSLILEEMTVGAMSYHARDWSGIFSLSGYKSGMGAIHRGDAKIVALGPQRAPLDDLSTFGISRRLPFKEVNWEKSSGGALLQGWTQVGESWIEMATRVGPNEIHLDIRGETPENTFLVFYAQGRAISVNDEYFLNQRELGHYRGPVTQLTILGNKDKIYIEPLGSQSVHILPLCGGEAFFDGDFLIAFAWSQDNLQWKIKF